MIKHSFMAGLLTLALSLTSFAAPPELKLPASVKGQPGQFVVLRAETTGKNISWKILTPGLFQIPSELLTDKKVAIFSAPKAGKYIVFAVTAAGDELSPIAEVVVIIGEPGPDPDPNPDPGPDPPAPTDELTKAFQAAFNADTTFDKKAKLRILIDCMKAAAVMTADTQYQTNGDLIEMIGKETGDKLKKDLITVRKAIGEYLNKNLPVDDVLLTADLRDKLKAAYTKVATSLEGVK